MGGSQQTALGGQRLRVLWAGATGDGWQSQLQVSGHEEQSGAGGPSARSQIRTGAAGVQQHWPEKMLLQGWARDT